MRTLLLLATIGAALLAACGGGTPTSMNQLGCTSLAPPALLYPAPNSTGQPDGNLDVWVGYPGNPSPGFSGPLLSASGQATVNGPAWLPPSPGPTNPPGMAPLPNGDSQFISGITSLASATTYTVSVTNAACNQSIPIGSFTTQ